MPQRRGTTSSAVARLPATAGSDHHGRAAPTSPTTRRDRDAENGQVLDEAQPSIPIGLSILWWMLFDEQGVGECPEDDHGQSPDPGGWRPGATPGGQAPVRKEQGQVDQGEHDQQSPVPGLNPRT